MKRTFLILGALVVLAGTVMAQNESRVTVVDETHGRDYFSFHVGAWFPKDVEKEFTFDDVALPKANSQIDQSQALGLDFHYRSEMGHPLYYDFSAGAWYSSYDVKPTALVGDLGQLQDATSWAVLVPLTLGLSFNVLPDNPIQPYAMAGLGAYVGITGREVHFLPNSQRINRDETRTLVRFGWYFGAGADFFLAPRFAISLAAKYQFLEYQEALYTQQKNFTGLQVLLGFTTRLR